MKDTPKQEHTTLALEAPLFSAWSSHLKLRDDGIHFPQASIFHIGNRLESRKALEKLVHDQQVAVDHSEVDLASGNAGLACASPTQGRCEGGG